MTLRHSKASTRHWGHKEVQLSTSCQPYVDRGRFLNLNRNTQRKMSEEWQEWSSKQLPASKGRWHRPIMTRKAVKQDPSVDLIDCTDKAAGFTFPINCVTGIETVVICVQDCQWVSLCLNKILASFL